MKDVKTRQQFSFSFPELRYSSLEFSSRKIPNTCQIEWNRIRENKRNEVREFNFQVTFSSPSLLLKLPNDVTMTPKCRLFRLLFTCFYSTKSLLIRRETDIKNIYQTQLKCLKRFTTYDRLSFFYQKTNLTITIYSMTKFFILKDIRALYHSLFEFNNI